MPDHNDATQTLKDLIDGLLGNLDAKSREALDRYLQIEQEFVSRQQDHVTTFLDMQADAHREFVRMVSSAFASASEMHNHHRAHVREAQKAFTEAHLRFVQHMRDMLRTPPPAAAPPPATPPRAAKRKARARRTKS